MRLRIFPFLLAITLSGTTLAALSSRDGDMDRYLKDQVAKGHTPSVAVAIVKDGKLSYAKAFGYADLENSVPATPRTVYRIGSLTKQFTAAMIMQMVNEGKITLDEPINTLLAGLPKTWAKVTVRNLLNHTSGIHSFNEVPGYLDEAAKPITPEGILKTIDSLPLDFDPGSAWHYDNTGYLLLGMIIEKLDGRSYADSLRARILTRLGMTETYVASERDIIPHRAQGYTGAKVGFQHALYASATWLLGAGSIETTVLDLAKWDAALDGDSILPQASLKQMWTQTILSNGKPVDYGFGWMLGAQNGLSLVEHGGGIQGFASYLKRGLTKRIGVIVLTNTDQGAVSGMAGELLAIADPAFRVIPPKPIQDHDPAATTSARKIMQMILDNNLDYAKLTPDFGKTMTPNLVKAASHQLSPLGKITAFVLLNSQVKDGLQIRTYRVTLGTTDLTFSLQINKDNLIANLDLR